MQAQTTLAEPSACRLVCGFCVAARRCDHKELRPGRALIYLTPAEFPVPFA